MKYPKKVIKKARKKGFNWVATDNDGFVYLYKNRPYYHIADLKWSTSSTDYMEVGKIDLGDINWRDSLYEIPPKSIYPKYVIKLAKHYGCKWVATNKSGAVYGYSTKPVVDDSQHTWNSTLLVSSKCPLNLRVDWTESLYEVK